MIEMIQKIHNTLLCKTQEFCFNSTGSDVIRLPHLLSAVVMVNCILSSGMVSLCRIYVKFSIKMGSVLN